MKSLNEQGGKIYIVATPIGNLDDITLRAIETLKKVDLILAEDTRHANILLQHYQIQTPCQSFHAHNEQKKTEHYLNMVQKGTQLALISDAGTPLICDPGYPLIQQAQSLAITIIPIPGPCALICALSAAGVPTDKFTFYGFPPAKSQARKNFFQQLMSSPDTSIFYESTHRIIESLKDLKSVLGPNESIILAKELTKSYEQFQNQSIEQMIEWLQQIPQRTKGEFVIIVPARDKNEPEEEVINHYLKTLLQHMGAKQASQIANNLLNIPKNKLYQMALKLQNH